MNHIDNPFEELEPHDVIVAYEAKNSEYYDILSYIPDYYVDVDLSESDRLRKAFIDHFKISKLPIIIIKGIPIHSDMKEKVNEYLDELETRILERIQGIIDPCLVTVFIKGSPTRPRCGFTRSLLEILYDAGLTEDEIKHFDILSDENIRRKLKEMNNWPTFPQVYIK